MDKLKSGWLSSELWLHLLHQAIVLAVLFGVIKPGSAATLEDEGRKDVAAVFVLIVSAYGAGQYLKSRHGLKQILGGPDPSAPPESAEDRPPDGPGGGLGVIGCLLTAVLLGGAIGLAQAGPPPAKACCPCGSACRCGPDCPCERDPGVFRIQVNGLGCRRPVNATPPRRPVAAGPVFRLRLP